ncbi:MAG: 4Fe-4S dicluster domain-containing protein [Syntrophales bacterium]|nr:4Fe-4S dicluster domain-containing protein [Syntrophales bacterium]
MSQEAAGISRRGFLKGAGSAALLGAAGALSLPSPVWARPGRYGTLIDLTRCDGCRTESFPMPRCVEACRLQNAKKFPEPVKPIRDLWPQKMHDDWSERRGVISTLTPYNWITVQKVDLGGEEVFIPRRCMHCDNPPCVGLCPFGALDKYASGAVSINPNLCLGGAKCKTVCPWHVPQRQSGVGIYLKLQPIPAGGGVMYKCDLCRDRLAEGRMPACVEACEKRLGGDRPLYFGTREEMAAMAHKRAEAVGGQIYGEKENGGTSTLYVSRIPFERIDAKLQERKTGLLMGKVRNGLDEVNRWAHAFWAGPAVLAAGAVGLVLRRRRNGGKEGD